MHRANHLMVRIADPDNLRLAFWKARKGKTYSQEVEAYRQNLDQNLLILRAQILRGSVEVGHYRYFKVYEPKERQICASAFSEQVLHHSLMNICHDHFIKETLGVKAYVRYMDDMVLWHDDKEVLKTALKNINDFVITELECTLKIPLLNRTSLGLPFLGYRLKRNSIQLTAQSKKRFLKKMKRVEAQYNQMSWSEARCQSHALPLLAFVQHADTEGVRKKIFN